MTELEQLQEWFARQCDASWEHQYGVAISTLDNPGWSLKVDLKATDLAEQAFDEVKIDRSESDWLVMRKSADAFEAFGGIGNLGEMIRALLDWQQRVRSL